MFLVWAYARVNESAVCDNAITISLVAQDVDYLSLQESLRRFA